VGRQSQAWWWWTPYRPKVVIQPTTGLDDVASGENRASTSIMADNDGVSGCRYLREGIINTFLIV
jgi:hypothetical protein